MVIREGRKGALDTLYVMAQIARESSRDPRIRMFAVSLVQRIQQKDYEGEACAILSYVRDRVRYVRDFSSAELLQPAQFTLLVNAGDCDDKCILLASLLASIGHVVRFIAIAQAPETYTHVWLQDYIYGQWLDLEPTEPIRCGSRVPSNGIVDTVTQDVG